MSDCKSGSCETAPCCTTQNQGDCCPVEKSIHEACCPVEKATDLWNRAFFVAMKEAQVDILKEKIRASWGGKLEKEADAVLASMAAHWQSMLAQAKARHDLQESLKHSLFEGCCK
jgi:hypothetical protein